MELMSVTMVASGISHAGIGGDILWEVCMPHAPSTEALHQEPLPAVKMGLGWSTASCGLVS